MKKILNQKIHRIITLVVGVALLWTLPLAAQVVKGSISGTVVDPLGAVVSGAQVKATNVGTGVTLTTTSDSSGGFRFNLIPVGQYKVEISAQGFKTATQPNILVSAGQDSGLGAVALTVGEVSTQVEVNATTPLIETTQSQITNTFTGVQLSTFAGVQENEGLDNLALFVPGVVASRDLGFSNTNGGTGFAVNGLRGRNNDQQIDGQNNNDNSIGGPNLFVTDPEFVQQYVIITNQFGPEYGRNAGSVVNIVTKSGSNAWHGSIYGNENNSILNSLNNIQRRFDGLTKPPRLNDEFAGFSIGGPWVKNKLFFFGGFDENIISSSTVYSGGGLSPTPAGLSQLAACFPASQSLAAFQKMGPYSISTGNPQPTGDISNIDVGACTGVPFSQVTRTLSTPAHIFNWISKLDWQLGNDTVMGRYIFGRTNFFNIDPSGGGGDASAGYVSDIPALSQAVLLSWTHNVSSRMVNEARFGFGRLNVEFGGNSLGTLPTTDGIDQALARITFSAPGFLAVGPSTAFPQGRIVNNYQAQDNWNYAVGRHTFKAGVNYTYQRSPNLFLPLLNGAYRFSSWTSFVNNTPNRVQIAQGNPSLDFREHDTFLYAGDDWKIGRALTLNLGLTWSYYGQPANLFNDITTRRESNPATQLWNPALPLSVRTFPRFDSTKTSFGPSAGFAYSPQWGGFLTGNGKMVLRGGYRMLYDPPFYNIYTNMAGAAPEVFLNTFNANTTPRAGILPLPATPTGPNVRAALQPFLLTKAFDPRSFNEVTISPDFGPDRVQSWNFGIERELGKNAAIEARYVGNLGQNLFQSVNGNPFIADLAADFPQLIPAGVSPCTAPSIVPGPGQITPTNPTPNNLGFGRQNCDLGNIVVRNNDGRSSYNGVQTEFRANNLFKQLTIRTGYTYSKTLDNVSEIFSTLAAGNSITTMQNPFKQSAEYSFSGLDFPHQWTVTFTEELPFYREQHGLMGRLLGGWAISANYILASGQRYTPRQFSLATITDLSVAQGGELPVTRDYFDSAFAAESARPYLGNLNAPQTAVGIFAGDACAFFGTGCSFAPTQLLLMDGVVQGVTTGTETTVTQNQVRFIANAATAHQVFGTPFGNTPRNVVTDAITNTSNFSVVKRIKFNERSSFEFRMTMLNALNHPNYTSIDPFIEDGGLQQASTGFGDPTLFNTTFAGSNGGTRRINFGGTLRF